MLFTFIVGLVAIILFVRLLSYKRINLSHIPGPTFSPWWRFWKIPDGSKTHINIDNLIKQYGRVMKVPYVNGEDILVLSDYESIYQATVTDGKTFGGRPRLFRTDVLTEATGILVSHKPDATWKTLRKTTQRHLRQFGDGLSRLESIITDIAEDMFSVFSENVGKTYDPRQIVFDTGLNSIAFLIIGKRTKTGDLVLEKMREYEKLFLTTASSRIRYMILDVFPWLRHLGWPAWKEFERTLQLEADIWKNANEYAENNPEAESICKVFREHIAEADPNLTETDAIKATLSLLLAGVTTTSNSFYATINILAHNKHIQDKLFQETQKIQETTGREANLQDRPQMPYARAVLYEVLRYVSVVANGVTHMSLEDGKISGYRVPAGTFVSMAIWTLHHDEEFWQDPYTFNPDRFLDDDGDLVPADHPNRKHLMPFGAGTRVCLGESLALTRLFLWLVTLVQRFEITPAKGNDKSTTDAREYNHIGVLKPTSYKVVFAKRF